jgi:hypothetical protein
MKRNIICLLSALVLLLLNSCTAYYYSMLDSNDSNGGKNLSHDFVQENDSAVVTYCFTGENAPVAISVYNKLDEPLYVDWARSALIIDDVASNYYQSSAIVHPDEVMPTGMPVPKGIGFVPPHSRIVETPLQLSNITYKKIPKEAYSPQTFARANNGEVTLPTCNFTEANSPLFFRSYLTLFVGDKDGKEKQHMNFQRSFYVSKVIRGGTLSPDNLLLCKNKAGDFFFISDHKSETTGTIAAAIAVGAVGVAVGATISPNEY